ncbi:hypothetical protein ACFU7Y_26500 [Kitasatospora sp. NPDC057542]|uniref:hypothetical protein n=1 Tax=Kitasatospora sp. NPDC057542 TaxID=3346162 RepID=UPI0036A33874
MTKLATEPALCAGPHAEPAVAALVGRAALLLREFNEAAMAGPTLDLAALAEAFDGAIAVLERLPNTVRHLGGHLMSAQRRGALADPLSRDTDELAERVRQRCHDTAEALPTLTATLRRARALVDGLSTADLQSPVAEGHEKADGTRAPGRAGNATGTPTDSFREGRASAPGAGRQHLAGGGRVTCGSGPERAVGVR